MNHTKLMGILETAKRDGHGVDVNDYIRLNQLYVAPGYINTFELLSVWAMRYRIHELTRSLREAFRAMTLEVVDAVHLMGEFALSVQDVDDA